MAQPEDLRDEFVRLWIRKADEDLALTEHLLSEDTPYLSAVAFHSQQAAEKYLKAFLVHRQCEFSKTHDLDRLLTLVATVNKPLAARLAPLSELSPYAVEARYPSDYPEVTNAEAEHARDLARQVGEAVKKAIGWL